MDKQGEGANKHHEKQLWLYLYLLGVKEGELLYVSKDDLAMLSYPVYLNDKKIEKEVFAELKILNDCWKNKTLPPMAEAGSWQEKFCRWHNTCKGIEESRTPARL
jgi:hypothetical protein